MLELPVARLVHWAPPRARLRIEGRRRDAAYFAALAEELSCCPAVASVTVNDLTASVVLGLSAPIHSAAEWALEKKLFLLASRAESGQPLDESVRESLLPFGRLVTRASGGAISLDTIIVLFLVCAAAVQFTRGNVLPAAATLFWCALDVLRRAAERQAAASRSWEPSAR